ncbi:hypothetical protein [Mycobacterium sp.]|uniref:glycosyltransferase n=1 Tax=Mycobacterium sp. TaxID=1785 RepID=UPI00333FFEC1
MMPSSAAAVEFAGPRQVRVAAVALPEPGPDEVVVTMHFSGISGGRELLAYRGEIDPRVPLDDRIESLDGTFTYPFRYGYACVGEADGQPVFAFHPHQNQFVARRDGCDRVRRVAAEVAHGAQNVDPQPVASPTTGSRSTSPAGTTSSRPTPSGSGAASPSLATGSCTTSCSTGRHRLPLRRRRRLRAAQLAGTVRHGVRRGLPLVGWRADNLPHLVSDGVEGVVLDPGDMPALAIALDRLASDELWRADVARAAGRRGAALPRWSHTAATLFAALKELTASAR